MGRGCKERKRAFTTIQNGGSGIAADQQRVKKERIIT